MKNCLALLWLLLMGNHAMATDASVSENKEIILDTPLGPLAGTLLTPATATKAVVLIVAGSGPTDRNGNVKGLPGDNNSLKYLAEALAGQGVATLRYDKRLIGASASDTLSEQDIRFDTYVNDTRLWLDWLTTRFDCPVWLLGHSEGALISTLVAQSGSAAGLVIVAGAGRRASDVILQQLQPRLPPALMEQTQTIINELLAGRTVDHTPPELSVLFRPSVQPYMMSWFRYDPAEEVARVKVPVLMLYGTTDIQVPVSDGRRLNTALPASRLVIIEGMNHVLKQVDGGLAAQIPSYSNPELPVVSGLTDTIASFIRQQK
ncbi:alpha/beta hydrolase [Spongorhabdus nitratireducens]